MSPGRGEESYLIAEDKISPIVEMTSACHSDQRDDCMDAGGRAMQGAIAEESCIMTLGDNYFEERRQQERAFKNQLVNTTMMEY